MVCTDSAWRIQRSRTWDAMGLPPVPINGCLDPEAQGLFGQNRQFGRKCVRWFPVSFRLNHTRRGNRNMNRKCLLALPGFRLADSRLLNIIGRCQRLFVFTRTSVLPELRRAYMN